MKLTVISLGAGVQSTTMALMAAHGEISPMPDCAIFADTGAEPQVVYDHLDWLETVLPFPVHRVSKGDLRSFIGSPRKARNPERQYYNLGIPVFVKQKNGMAGGYTKRECTREFKIRPIVRKVRELLGVKRAPKHVAVEQWIGISLDEIIRMKRSWEPWIEHRWPLIEKRMRRGDCLNWFREHYPGRSLTKSACTFCPYHGDREWQALTEAEFADAVEVDRRLRDRPGADYHHKGEMYLHRSCKPLDQVDLSTAEERGQLNLFLNECEGMCNT